LGIKKNDLEQLMSDLTPGSEEDFIRQLQEQLANESGNSNLSNEKSSFDFNPSEIEDIKTINEGENISQSKDNKSAKNKNVKQKDINKEKSNLYIFLDVVEIFGFPLVLLGGIFLLNYFLKDLIIGIVSSLIGSLLIGGYIKLLINLKLSESYKTSEEILNEIGKGKLSFDILNDEALKKRLGKLAEPIDKVVKEMSDMVTKMELSVLDIVGNSDALAYFATSMANKTDQQEDSIIRIDNSTKKLDESMQNVKSNVDSAYSISKNSIKEADNSSIEILSLIQEMHTINDMSDKILTTMNFISDIADETNLLALNAAIQAAHAGEEGKGFGVVASEIRNLAESSSKAAKSIFQIVETTVESINKGVELSERAKKALAKIINSIKSTEDLMSEMSNSISLQSETTTRLKESVSDIQEKTKNINSDTQNMKSAISNLSGQAQILSNIVKGFEVHSSSIKSDVIFGVG